MSDEILFSDFCKVCEKVINSNNFNFKCDILQKFINDNRSSNDDLYSLIRLLVPQIDKERGAYGLKEYLLAKTYIRILCLPKEGTDYEKLTKLHSTKKTGKHVCNDFAEAAYNVLKNKCDNEFSQFTLGEINSDLDAIAVCNMKNDPRGIDFKLSNFIYKLSALEQKWVIRIILKDMNLGIGTKKILKFYHPDANELLEISNSLKKICTDLRDPKKCLNELEISLNNPFRPMLSKRCEIHSLQLNRDYYVETKMDGERVQIHYDNGTFKYFTRNGYDFTASYGVAENNNLSQEIQSQLGDDVTNFIIDGEMMVWHKDKKKLIFQGHNVDVKKLKNSKNLKPCYFVFDIVYLNGKILTNTKLKDRINILNGIFIPKEGVIMHVSRDFVRNAEEVLNALNDAICNREEGIIIKCPDSVYKPNSRKDDWKKIKPEYTEGAMVELDMLIIGGYYGKRSSNICQFLLGVPYNEVIDEKTKFYSVCKVGTGITFNETVQLREKLKYSWKEFKSTNIPDWMVLKSEKPNFFINPSDSIILQIKASEIVRSTSFGIGYTLRFPRIEKVRFDKLWNNCLTAKEFHEIREPYDGKLTAGPIKLITKTQSQSRKRKLSPETESGQNFHSGIFKRKKFIVLTGSEKMPKEIIEKQLLTNAGCLAQFSNLNDIYCFLAGDLNLQVKNIARAQQHDVISVHWINDCIKNQIMLPFSSRHIISPSKTTQKSKHFDKYGDSFIKLISVSTLKNLIDKITIKWKDKKYLLALLFSERKNPYSLFENCYAYFDSKCSLINIRKFKFLNGTVVHDITHQNLTHIIISSNSDIGYYRNFYMKHHVVYENWIFDSWRNTVLNDIYNYNINNYTK